MIPSRRLMDQERLQASAGGWKDLLADLEDENGRLGGGEGRQGGRDGRLGELVGRLGKLGCNMHDEKTGGDVLRAKNRKGLRAGGNIDCGASFFNLAS